MRLVTGNRQIIREGHCIRTNGVNYLTCTDNIKIEDYASIALWLRVNDKANGYIFSKPNVVGGGTPSASIALYYIAAQKQLCVFFTSDEEHCGNFYCPLNGWVFLVVIKNGNNFDTYRNGVHVSHLITQGGDLQDCESGFTLGSRAGSSTSKGYFSTFQWYPSALTEQEIRGLYLGQNIKKEMNVQYLFTEQQGTTTADTSGNGHTGTVASAMWDDVTPPWGGIRSSGG